jgi:hypothetical protein
MFIFVSLKNKCKWLLPEVWPIVHFDHPKHHAKTSTTTKCGQPTLGLWMSKSSNAMLIVPHHALNQGSKYAIVIELNRYGVVTKGY